MDMHSEQGVVLEEAKVNVEESDVLAEDGVLQISEVSPSQTIAS